MMTINILDIDLDFFMHTPFFGLSDGGPRLSTAGYKAWNIAETKDFLENNCNLTKGSVRNRAFFENHSEVFYFLRDLYIRHNYNTKFSIDHIDTHADLGGGDASFMYICSEMVNLPSKKKLFPEPWVMHEKLGSGNYLAYLAASEMVNKINFIYNPKLKEAAVPPIHCLDFKQDSGFLEFKKFTRSQVYYIENDLSMIPLKEGIAKVKEMGFSRVEPLIPFHTINGNDFKTNKEYQYLLLTRSPGFTTSDSDKLIPVIMDYSENTERIVNTFSLSL